MMGELKSIKRIAGKERHYKIIFRLDKNLKPEKFEEQFKKGQILILANFERDFSQSYFDKFEGMKHTGDFAKSKGRKVTDRVVKCERCKGKGKIRVKKKSGKRVIKECPSCEEGYTTKEYKSRGGKGKHANKEV